MRMLCVQEMQHIHPAGRVDCKRLFLVVWGMEVQINPRGNGACPLCYYNGRCSLQKKITAALEDVKKKEEFELVVYTCPQFKEKF